jgi:ClpP class serine protease
MPAVAQARGAARPFCEKVRWIMAKKKQPLQTADSVIEQDLDARMGDVEEVLGADGIAFSGPIYYGAENLIRGAVEFRFGNRAARKRKLVVLLETQGGYIEVAQRIVQVFRKHYREVDFIVPSHAMSAGTVLALSADAIYMDYFSILGPIDPQVKKGSSRFRVGDFHSFGSMQVRIFSRR